MGYIPLLPYFSGISTLLPVIISIFYLRGNGLGKKQMLTFWILAACSEIVGFITAINRINNHWFLLIFTFCEFLLIANILKSWEPNLKVIKKYKWGIFSYATIYILVAVTLLNSGFLPEDVNGYLRPASSLLICFLAMRLFYNIFIDLNVVPHKDYRFYFAASILIYFATGGVIFAIPLVGFEISSFWQFHSIINIIHNVLFIAVIYCFRNFPVAPLEQHNSIISMR